jgi:hypothetical protein
MVALANRSDTISNGGVVHFRVFGCEARSSVRANGRREYFAGPRSWRGGTIARLVEGVRLLQEIWFIGRYGTVIGEYVVGMGEGRALWAANLFAGYDVQGI